MSVFEGFRVLALPYHLMYVLGKNKRIRNQGTEYEPQLTHKRVQTNYDSLAQQDVSMAPEQDIEIGQNMKKPRLETETGERSFGIRYLNDRASPCLDVHEYLTDGDSAYHTTPKSGLDHREKNLAKRPVVSRVWLQATGGDDEGDKELCDRIEDLKTDIDNLTTKKNRTAEELENICHHKQVVEDELEKLHDQKTVVGRQVEDMCVEKESVRKELENLCRKKESMEQEFEYNRQEQEKIQKELENICIEKETAQRDLENICRGKLIAEADLACISDKKQILTNEYDCMKLNKQLAEKELENAKNGYQNVQREVENVNIITQQLSQAQDRIGHLKDELLDSHRKREKLYSRLEDSDELRQNLELTLKIKVDCIQKLETELLDWKKSYQELERVCQNRQEKEALVETVREEERPGLDREALSHSSESGQSPRATLNGCGDPNTERKRLGLEHSEKRESMSQDKALGRPSLESGHVSEIRCPDSNTERKRLLLEYSEAPEIMEHDEDVRNEPGVHQDNGTEIPDQNPAVGNGTILGQICTARLE